MGAEQSSASAGVRVVSSRDDTSGEDADLLALRQLRPYQPLMRPGPRLNLLSAPPELAYAPLRAESLLDALGEVQRPLRAVDAVLIENQRVLERRLCSVDDLVAAAARVARRQMHDLRAADAGLSAALELEPAISEAHARLASALECTERLRRLLPEEFRPPPFDADALPLYGAAVVSPASLAGLIGLPGRLPGLTSPAARAAGSPARAAAAAPAGSASPAALVGVALGRHFDTLLGRRTTP